MRKIYFITSIPATSKDGAITGVVANGTGRKATAAEIKQLVVFLREKGASQSLIDSLRDSTYPGPVSAFDRRAEARQEVSFLNDFGGLFSWSVIGLGESIRKPVTQPLGWRLMINGRPSSFNRIYHDIPDAGGVRIEVDHADRFGGDTDANFLFSTRQLGRLVARDNGLFQDYSLVPVYGDA